MTTVPEPTRDARPFPGAPGERTWRRWVGFAVGVGLLAGAIAVVAARRETLGEAFDALRTPDPGLVLVLLASVAGNVVLTGIFLRLLLSRYGRVGALEMQAVAAGAALVNYLPLRPGLFGRIAYHRAVNDIPVRDTVKTVAQSAVITVGIALHLAGAAAWAQVGERPLLAGVVAPLPLVAAGLLSRRLRVWAAAALVRYVEVGVWAVRYGVAFALVGAPIGAEVALAFACVSVIATMVPFVSNGLGLREWAIGLLAPIITSHQLELGVTAELVNRAAELLVIGVLGGIALPWLARTARVKGDRSIFPGA
jgi:hypothetical protein